VSVPSNLVRFGSFDLDLVSGELRRDGLRVRLADQPLQVLTLLLDHTGELVTREDLRQRLWSSDTFVDFDHSLNAAVKRLRDALCDSADHPRFIETLPHHGYRFIAQVEPANTGLAAAPPAGKDRRARQPRRIRWAVVAALLFIAAVVFWSSLIPNAEIRVIAVLPLNNLSHDPKQEYFSDSMTEALITELGQVRSVRVISHQSVMQYKGSTKTLRQIGRELEAGALVEGAVLCQGDVVRISVQLIRVQPEEHLWAQSYDGNLKDVITLQRDVARDIATQIQITLTPHD